jgi:hypothetical protein
MKLFKDYDFSQSNPEFFYFVKILPQPKNEPELLPPLYINSLTLPTIHEHPTSNKKKMLPSLNSRIMKLFSGKEVESIKELSAENENSIEMSEIKSLQPQDPRLQELDKQLENLLKIFERNESDFIKFKEKNDYRLSKIIEDSNPVVLIRVRDTYNVKPEVILDSLMDIDKRASWDKVLRDVSIIEKIDEETDIMYNSTVGVMGASPRDFVQIRKIYKDMKGYDYIVLMKSIEHEEKPIMKKKVRAKCIIGGYVMKSIGPGRTKMEVVMQVDVNGLLPKFIVNSFAPSKTHDWFKQFNKYIRKQETNPPVE